MNLTFQASGRIAFELQLYVKFWVQEGSEQLDMVVVMNCGLGIYQTGRLQVPNWKKYVCETKLNREHCF